RVMNSILQNDSDYAKAFIDDIAVFSNSWLDHLKHLDKVLTKIQDSGLTLKLAKTKLLSKSLLFLGHRIGGGLHGPDSDKLAAVEKLLFPKTKRQMRSLIGLISFYRKYIPHLSEVTSCLTDMTRKTHPNILKPVPIEMQAF